MVRGSLARSASRRNSVLRAGNKTPTACEPLLFVASFEKRDSTRSRQILRNVNEAAASAARRAAANTRVELEGGSGSHRGSDDGAARANAGRTLEGDGGSGTSGRSHRRKTQARDNEPRGAQRRRIEGGACALEESKREASLTAESKKQRED